MSDAVPVGLQPLQTAGRRRCAAGGVICLETIVYLSSGWFFLAFALAALACPAGYRRCAGCPAVRGWSRAAQGGVDQSAPVFSGKNGSRTRGSGAPPFHCLQSRRARPDARLVGIE